MHTYICMYLNIVFGNLESPPLTLSPAILPGCQNVVEMPIAKQLHFGYFAVKSGISMAAN